MTSVPTLIFFQVGRHFIGLSRSVETRQIQLHHFRINNFLAVDTILLSTNSTQMGQPSSFISRASFRVIYELLQDKSQIALAVCGHVKLDRFTLTSCGSPLTSYMDAKVTEFREARLSWSFWWLDSLDLFKLWLCLPCFGRLGKMRSVPCKRVLLLLLSFLRGFGHLRKICSSLRKEKQILFSAIIFALCVSVFSLKSLHNAILDDVLCKRYMFWTFWQGHWSWLTLSLLKTRYWKKMPSRFLIRLHFEQTHHC